MHPMMFLIYDVILIYICVSLCNVFSIKTVHGEHPGFLTERLHVTRKQPVECFGKVLRLVARDETRFPVLESLCAATRIEGYDRGSATLRLAKGVGEVVET